MNDLGPLREWYDDNKHWLETAVIFQEAPLGWRADLKAALKAAGVIEDEPDVEKAWNWWLSFGSHASFCGCGCNDARRIIERAREAK